MKGFTKQGLLIFPKRKNYEALSNGDVYYDALDKAVNNAMDLIDSIDAKSYALTTDEIAIEIAPSDILWIDVITPEDKFFLKRNISDYKSMPDADIELPTEYLEDARVRYPIEKGVSKEERLKIIREREKFLFRKLALETRLIFSFEVPSSRSYPLPNKYEDDRILIDAGTNNMKVKALIFGEPGDLVEVFSNKTLRRSIDRWEV